MDLKHKHTPTKFILKHTTLRQIQNSEAVQAHHLLKVCPRQFHVISYRIVFYRVVSWRTASGKSHKEYPLSTPPSLAPLLQLIFCAARTDLPLESWRSWRHAALSPCTWSLCNDQALRLSSLELEVLRLSLEWCRLSRSLVSCISCISRWPVRESSSTPPPPPPPAHVT